MKQCALFPSLFLLSREKDSALCISIPSASGLQPVAGLVHNKHLRDRRTKEPEALHGVPPEGAQQGGSSEEHVQKGWEELFLKFLLRHVAAHMFSYKEALLGNPQVSLWF